MAVHIATWLKSLLLAGCAAQETSVQGIPISKALSLLYQQSFIFASLRKGICTGVGLQLPVIYVPASCCVCNAKDSSAVDEIMYNRLQTIMLQGANTCLPKRMSKHNCAREIRRRFIGIAALPQ